MSPALWEATALARPYFDPEGLIVAMEYDRPIGFVHAGFAGDAEGSALDKGSGLVCTLQIARRADESAIAAQLLQRAERYLKGHGAATLSFGNRRGACPFYMGLLGGATCPGIFDGDERTAGWVRTAGFEPICETIVYHCRLAGFRPTVDRTQMQLRRSYSVQSVVDGYPKHWWNACTFGWGDCFRFQVSRCDRGPALGDLWFWDMEPLASALSVHARGMIRLELPDDLRTPEMTTFFLGQSLKQFADDGVTLAEVQAEVGCQPLIAVLGRLGFVQSDQAVIWSKSLDSPGQQL